MHAGVRQIRFAFFQETVPKVPPRQWLAPYLQIIQPNLMSSPFFCLVHARLLGHSRK